jgi:hypothetical protein
MAVAGVSLQSIWGAWDAFRIGKLVADALGFVTDSLGFSPYFIGLVDLLLQSNGAGIM